MYKFKRKLYTRGSSFETTIPMPILFSIDKEKKHNVVFAYDSEKNRWYIELEQEQKNKTKQGKNHDPNKKVSKNKEVKQG
ncbi:hypothetical protein GOV05_04320 [Candidatus Woesearchaeota archaeon]|nr:hypothetical protein [Candidatus Woesearchaeota archaeon]